MATATRTRPERTLDVRPFRVERPYQLPLKDYFYGGGTRAVAVWHRRAGKDTTALDLTKILACQRVGLYWHMLPTLAQARKVIWDGIGKDGKRVMQSWRADQGLVVDENKADMKLGLANGSIWQLVGSDNYDSLIGSNPLGVVFSEWSVADPRAWEFIRPILAENGGWALFIYTPRGRNHGYRTYRMAKENPNWFCELLTVDDTHVISHEAIQDDREAGMPPEVVEQEYYCSFDAPLHGAIYGPQMSAAMKAKRITSVPHDRSLNVHTWWDLGRSDAMAIWFVQFAGPEIHVIDYYENRFQDLPHYAAMLARKRDEGDWVYGDHVWPHDGGAVRLGMGGEALNEQMKRLGFRVKVQPRHDVWAGILKTRAILDRCWFDEDACYRGIEALKSYHLEEDETRGRGDVMNWQFFKEKPRHDWASHGADAFRTGVMAEASPAFTGGRQFRQVAYPEDHISEMEVL